MFRATYRHDPVAFIHDCIKWGGNQKPTFYQNEILADLELYKREAIRGPHGLGKSTMMSWAVIWFSITRDEDEDWKVITTASAWRQLSHFLWPEINKWLRKINWGKVGRPEFTRHELLKLSLKLHTGEAFPIASDNPESLEGAHADSMLFIFDESKAVPDATFDALDGAFSGTGEKYAIVASTPGAPSGRFYDIHAKKKGLEKWHTRHVTIDEAIKSGRIDPQWVEEHKDLWGETSSVFIQRVLGEFAADDSNTVIPLAWVEAAIERWKAWKEAKGELPEFTSLGFDVAEEGEDKNCLAYRYKNIIGKVERSSMGSTMEAAGKVVSFMKSIKRGKVVIDSNGIGSGAYSRIKEQGVKVYGFKAQERAESQDETGELEFADKRTEAWWNLRELLDPKNPDPILLPEDDEMIGDLTTPTWRFLSNGKVKVEEKKEIRKRLKRSTDTGDAVVMAFYRAQNTSLIGFAI